MPTRSVSSLSDHEPTVEDRPGDALRRWINLSAAAIGLVVCAPLMALIAIGIKLTSPGPVLYMQTRIGLNRRNGRNPHASGRRARDLGGRPFRIYKFRTMHVRAGAEEDESWTAPDDPRVTGFGRILRKYRLDELPQLFNVLKGDMNIVGPRPEQPQIFSVLQREIERYAERQRVRPGITGWAQVNHHYGRSIEDVRKKLLYDLEYIRSRSVIQDLRIMLLTLPVVLLRRGAW